MILNARGNGQTRFIRIKSLAGESCRIKTDLKDPVRLTADGQVPVAMDTEGVVALDLEKGEEAILVSDGYSGDLTIEPGDLDPRDCNHYGVKDKGKKTEGN